MKYYCKTILFIFTALVLSAFGFAGSAQATTKYLVNAGGNWTDTNAWSTVSAKDASRVGGAGVPAAGDDVVLDNYSGNLTIDGGNDKYLRSLDCVVNGNYSGTITFSTNSTLNIGASTPGANNIALRFYSGTVISTFVASNSIRFVSTSATVQTLDFATVNVGSGTINFNAPSNGSWQVASGAGHEWGTSSVSPLLLIALTKGTLDTNGQTCYWGAFINTTTATFTLGTSTIHFYNNSTVIAGFNMYWQTTFSGANSTFIFENLGGQYTHVMSATNKIFGTVVIHGSGVASFNTNNSTINTLERVGSNVKTDIIQLANDLTVSGELKVQGYNSTNRMLFMSSTLGTSRTLTVTGATISNCQNVDFRDITFVSTGAVNLSAITGGSGDCGGNSISGGGALTFTPSTDWYWKNTTTYAANTYHWSEYSNWYTATNGTGSQMPSTRVPLPQDNTYFDNNSVSGTTTINQDMPRMGKTLDFSNGTGVAAMTFGLGHGNENMY